MTGHSTPKKPTIARKLLVIVGHWLSRYLLQWKPDSWNVAVPQPPKLEKKENQHKLSQAHVPTFWSLQYIFTYICNYICICIHIFFGVYCKPTVPVPQGSSPRTCPARVPWPDLRSAPSSGSLKSQVQVRFSRFVLCIYDK